MSVRRVAEVELVETEAEPAARPLGARRYAAVASTARIDAAAGRARGRGRLPLESAVAERNLRRLASEIAATTRRVNALEHQVLPRLERDRIALVLEEREHEDATRLRRAKRRREQAAAR